MSIQNSKFCTYPNKTCQLMNHTFCGTTAYPSHNICHWNHHTVQNKDFHTVQSHSLVICGPSQFIFERKTFWTHPLFPKACQKWQQYYESFLNTCSTKATPRGWIIIIILLDKFLKSCNTDRVGTGYAEETARSKLQKREAMAQYGGPVCDLRRRDKKHATMIPTYHAA